MDKYQHVIDYMSGINCFNSYNGIILTRLEDDYSEGRVDLTLNSLNPNGKVHGGLLFSLCDYTGGFVASVDKRVCVTQGASFSFLRPACGEYLICKAVPVKIGQKIAVVECCVYDDNEKLAAKGTFTYFFME